MTQKSGTNYQVTLGVSSAVYNGMAVMVYGILHKIRTIRPRL